MNDTASAMVLYEDPSFLIVDKRAGIPTVPLKESPPDEPTLLGQIGELFPEVLTVNGRNGWEGGVLHRLDTPTSGLVVIARTDAAYQRLLSISQGGLFIKEYQAKSSAKERVMQSTFPPYPYEDPVHCGGREVAVGSLFRHWGEHRREVRPVLSDSPRHILDKSSPTWYLTRIFYGGETTDGTHSFTCQLSNGFRHQVRAHLAWSGWPIDGDERYGGTASHSLALRAIGVEFPHPFTGERIEVWADR
ncbi:MAG TPA: pseudouridine synthase [Sphaerochaeta sp.]|jgi:23S rRNA pseudouridine1911/1915/1917 synthase|nr:pseudouridine synthase [Spirochaetota bacterium]NLV60035.1 RNA pseudouridine synthase [Spirochaetales bacterium]HPY12051.1 pseudouridine synthase [Sphaerochaeta sp.]